jgi:YVTN family beta-propeller protein
MTRLEAMVACATLSVAALSACTTSNRIGQWTATATPRISAQVDRQAAVDTRALRTPSSPGARASAGTEPGSPLLGMPPPLSTTDVWAADRPNNLSPVVRGMPYRIYVPNSLDNTVTIIDPRTYKVLRTFRVGHEPQHVVPSWDLKTLWVNNDLGNSVTPIDARTGRVGRPLKVHDPYNLYFTPDGKHAIVMASNDHLILFVDPHTMAVQKRVPARCAGVNHADFSADGRFFLVSCEFSGDVIKVDTAAESFAASLKLPRRPGGMAPKPQDVKLSPDGSVFYVADMMNNGVWLLDGVRMRVIGFVHTGLGAHGLYVTRDSRDLIISNRDAGSVSLLDFASRRVVATWHIPGGGSPDMGGLSPNGAVLWLSGRYGSEVYAISMRDGHLIARIHVGRGPHGLAVYPQPGRYSMGHTGVLR